MFEEYDGGYLLPVTDKGDYEAAERVFLLAADFYWEKFQIALTITRSYCK